MAAVLKKRALAEYSQTSQTQIFQPPFKKLRLVKKSPSSGSAIAFINLLEKCKNSNEALQALLRVSDSLEFECVQITEALKKLADHFKVETESAVRVKILSLFGDIGSEQGADVLFVIDETISLLKNEKSHKVIAQGVSTLLRLSLLVSENGALYLRLVELARNYLKDISHAVKCRCLELIGALLPMNNVQAEPVLKLVTNHFHSEDARVRSEAFITMICFFNRGFKLNPAMYYDVSAALQDDYEIVRRAALRLVCILGNAYPENLIVIPESEQEVRLIDDAFGKVCNAVNDLSMNVRMLAVQLLGSMTLVSSKFLHQTLDKKLMSNMRKKRSAHELAWESVTSGEWASGKKWADDRPRELVDAESVNLMSSGACGAFVHGLEDEYLEVRSAAVESLCQLSQNDPQFASMSLDFLVDMFNDEIEEVRIHAIDGLRQISDYIMLREDQLETILGALEDFSGDVREGLHRMLAACRLATTACLRMCVERLLDNLRRYPQDKRSTYQCMQRIGSSHADLALPLVPRLLAVHPFFDTAEPDVDTPAYVCVLILALNAASRRPAVLEVVGPHALRHYAYLRDTMPNLVPAGLDGGFGQAVMSTGPCAVSSGGQEAALKLLDAVAGGLEAAAGAPPGVRGALLCSGRDQLRRLATMEGGAAGAAHFAALYMDALLLGERALARESSGVGGNAVQQLLRTCLQLEHLFVGLSAADVCAVRELRLRALAVHLVVVARGSSASALAPCHHLLAAADAASRALAEPGAPQPHPFTAAALRELAALDEPKPGAVARALAPLLARAARQPAAVPRPGADLRMTAVNVLEPTAAAASVDSALKFTAGLVAAVPLHAELSALAEPSRLRITVRYPDQRVRVLVPRAAHLKPLHEGAPGDLRLRTSVPVSHHVWSEACTVAVALALAVPEADVTRRRPHPDSPACLLELCRPVHVCVAPKPVKRGAL